MNRKKNGRWFWVLFLIVTIWMQSACGKAGVGQGNPEINGSGEIAQGAENPEEHAQGAENNTQDAIFGEQMGQSGVSEDGIVLQWEYPYLYYQYDAVEQTWEKDYSSEEWEGGTCLNFYVMITDMEGQQIPMIEDELNHRLHMAGYDFYLHFMGPTMEEMYGGGSQGETDAERLITERRSEGAVVDLWITRNYLSALQSGEILELTDFLQSGEGSSLDANFDDCVWENVRDENGCIYGVPLNPIATARCVYEYTPQLMERLSIDMSAFSGDPGELEERFPDLQQEGILPLYVDFLEEDDALMLSLFGLENYGGILAVRHEDGDWKAVDLWEEEEAIACYIRLGEWKEKGYVGYNDALLQNFKENGLDISGEDDSRYSHILFRLGETDVTAKSTVVNGCGENNGNTMTRYWVPEQPAYISDRGSLAYGTAVISAQTEHPQECMQFLRLLFTDADIRLLLYQGIEGYSYQWKDDVLMNARAYGFPIGLGLGDDLRDWPVGDWGAEYAAEAAAMNRNVSVGIGMTMPYDISVYSDAEYPGLADKEAACRQIINENYAVFYGYYGNETERKLEEVHEQLVEAGYLELIEAVNADCRKE